MKIVFGGNHTFPNGNLRIEKGKDTGEALTGDEVTSQFLFNDFKGVGTELKSDYMEISVRVTATLDNMLET